MKKLYAVLLPLCFFVSTQAQFTQEWVSQYNGTNTGPRNDDGKKVACDKLRNVYVFGNSDNNLLLVKYDAAGNVKWTRQVNGTDNSNDVAKDLVIDSAGFVYIAGDVHNSLSFIDALIAKYDSLGNRIWINSFDVPLSSQGANAISVDDNSFVYVAGYSSSKCLTLKLDPSGNVLWSRTYLSTTTGGQMSDVATDPNGNVFVTGSYGVAGAGNDWLTIKYDPLGNLIWSKTKNGTLNSNDYPAVIVVDSLSNVYVAGSLQNSVTDGDAFLICYDSLGTTQWFNSYNGPASNNDNYFAMKKYNGYLYLTGRANGSMGDEILTRVLSTAGSLQWSQLYSTAANDAGNELVVDSLNNLYVCGNANGAGITLKYDNLGSLTWSKPVAETTKSLFMDSNGDIAVVGSAGSAVTDYSTLKYDQAGTLLWSRVFDSGLANFFDRTCGIEVDKNGNTYVAGTSDNYPAGADWFLYKLDPSGAMEWVRTVSSLPSVGLGDRAQAIAVDRDNNIIVGGYVAVINFSYAHVIKYDSAGNVLWTYIYGVGVPPGQGSFVNDIEVDSIGNVYFTGTTATSSYGDDAYTVKLDPYGNELWVRTLDGGYGGTDIGNNIHVDPTGNVYVSGGLITTYPVYEIFLRKYDPAGTTLWTRTYTGTTTSMAVAQYSRTLMADPMGNIIVGGFVKNTGSGDDYVLKKYDPSGNVLWTRNYFFDISGTSAMGEDGSFYTIGDSISGVYKVCKTDPAGNIVWGSFAFPGYIYGTVTSYGKSNCMMVKNNRLYVVAEGKDNLATTGRDYVLIQYDSIGNQENVNYFDAGNDGMNEDGFSIQVNDFGNIYVTGYGAVNSGLDVYTLKYCNRPPLQPSSFAEGDSVVCDGNSYIYSVPFTGASSYLWSYSGTGAVLSADDNVLNILFSPGATSGTLSFLESNTCGTILPTTMNIIVNAVTPALLTAAADTVCSASGIVALTGTPAGGTYSGPGVSGSSFNPGAVSLGLKTLTYTVTDSNACSSSASVNIYVELCTSIKENEGFNVNLFPNPASSFLTLEIDPGKEQSNIYVFEIMDVTGRMLKREEFTTLRTIISRDELSSGIYFYKLYSERSAISQGKLIFK